MMGYMLECGRGAGLAWLGIRSGKWSDRYRCHGVYDTSDTTIGTRDGC